MVQCFRSRPTKPPVRKVALAVLIPSGWSRQFPHPLWDVSGLVDRVPFRRTFGVSSLRSLSCSLCCAQDPASLLLSKGLLSPGQRGQCPEGSLPHRRGAEMVSAEGGSLGLKIDSSHPFPGDHTLLKPYLQILQSLSLSSSVLSPLGVDGKGGGCSVV